MTRPYTPYAPPGPDRFDDLAEPMTDDGYHPDYDDYTDDYDEYDEPIDRRWIWVAAVAGAILLVAVICTSVILGGGDSGSVSGAMTTQAPTSQPATTTAPPPAASRPAPTPVAPLPPETVTTVTPAPTATAESTTPAAPAAPAPPGRTVTYQVSGNRQLIDLVTVIYTDQQGALQTDINVALPWTKTVVLDPGVALSSVTATSMGGQLDCAITDGAGATLAEQNNNTMIATCTK